MSEIERKAGLDDIEYDELQTILDTPDIVYVNKKGKMYYPTWCKQGTIEIPLDKAVELGYKPSAAYQKFLEDIKQSMTTVY